jgi:hypothetical protein
VPAVRLPAYALYGARVPPPTPSQVVPNSGPVEGGQLTGIIGGGLLGSTGVTFGGNAASEVVVIGGGTMVQSRTPMAPLLAPGPVEVVLLHAGGNVVVPGGYTYNAADETEPEPDEPDEGTEEPPPEPEEDPEELA